MRYSKYTLSSLLILSSTVSFPLVATENTVALDLEIITVTANRRSQPLSEVGSSVTVLTAEDLKLSQEIFVLSALEATPGVAVSQNGAFGGVASVSIRGAGGDNTVVLIDGVQLNDASATGNGYNFGTLDTHNIARIEVLRGPQSVLYGSDAIGGVINIITKTYEEGFGGDVFAETGSYNTLQGGATMFGGTEVFGYNVSASSTHTNGVSAADENDGNPESDGLKSLTLSGKVISKLSDSVRLEFMTRYSDNESDFDSFGPSDGDEVSHVDELTLVGRGYFDILEGRLSNTVSVEYAEIDRQNFTNGAESYQAKGERVNLDILGVFAASKDWTLTYGAQHETVKASNLGSESFAIDSLLSELAYTGTTGLTLTAGLRYDNHETYGTATTARVTGSYEIKSSGTRFIANWGEGFKSPSVFQLTYICTFCGLTAPTADLKPETATGYELGLEQMLLDNRIQLSATYFHLKANNAIDFTFTGGYQNVAERLSEGLEFGLDAQLSDQLDVRASYTYTDAKDPITDIAQTRQPKHLLSGSITWQPIDPLSLRASLVRNGAEEQSFGAGTLSAWTRLDLRASYQFRNNWSLHGRIDNAFDKEYQHILGYGTPDRSFYVGIRKTL